ncbi:hypothetical protein [Dactylosporangium aurantiacum]|nr:hypothetical protein [Dactylosporangium aurantiacum]MDG6105883.1 hypothetical protein [Dactylosporangium aurantiacum]
MSGAAAVAYAVLVMIAALFVTGPLDLLSLPAPGQSASGAVPAGQRTPVPVLPGGTGKRAGGGPSVRSSPAPGAASPSVRPSGTVTAAPSPGPATPAPSAAPSAGPSPGLSAGPTATGTPDPTAPPSDPPTSVPGVTVLVIVGPA